jgi:hypothetical protein
MSSDLLSRDNQFWAALDATGYKVEAVDGAIGRVDEATDDVEAALIVVTGPLNLGPKVRLPLGVVDLVDDDDEKIYVSLTKDDLHDLPEYAPGPE